MCRALAVPEHAAQIGVTSSEALAKLLMQQGYVAALGKPAPLEEADAVQVQYMRLFPGPKALKI